MSSRKGSGSAMNGGGPTPDQARAVRKALRSRNRQLRDDVSSIEVFLRLNGDATQGPPLPGSSSNRLLVQFYSKVATELRTISDAVAAVDFPADDKHQIRTSLAESAKAWDSRAKMVGTLDQRAVTNALNAALAHERTAAQQGKILKTYFPDAM